MLKQKERNKVYYYMLKEYPIDEEFFKPVDDEIWKYVIGDKKVCDNIKSLEKQLMRLKAKFMDELILQQAITPTCVMLEERICQIRLLIDRAYGKSDIDDLTKLTFCASFDTSWIEEQQYPTKEHKEAIICATTN